MGESAWVDAEDYLKAQFLAQMGPTSSYTSLKVRKVVISILRDQARWEKIASESGLPLLIIEGSNARFNLTAHPATFEALDAEYQNAIIAFVDGDDEEQAARNAKIMLKRMAKVLISLRTGFDGSDGERLEFQPVPVRGDPYVIPKQNSEGSWAGVAILSYTVGNISRGR